jgi:transposase
MFVFFGKRHEAIKVIFFDGSGLCLFYKRLDRGIFRVPELRPGEGMTVEIAEAALDDLLDGIDVQAKRPRATPPRGSSVH